MTAMLVMALPVRADVKSQQSPWGHWRAATQDLPKDHRKRRQPNKVASSERQPATVTHPLETFLADTLSKTEPERKEENLAKSKEIRPTSVTTGCEKSRATRSQRCTLKITQGSEEAQNTGSYYGPWKRNGSWLDTVFLLFKMGQESTGRKK